MVIYTKAKVDNFIRGSVVKLFYHVDQEQISIMIKSNQPICGFFDRYRFLSNFAPVSVVYNNIEFTTVEHAYVAAKTTDVQQQQYVSRIYHAGHTKRYGRLLNIRPDWESIKLTVMRDLLIQKYTQMPYEQLLIDTGVAYLEETNTWGDRFWGVSNGKGSNHLGRLLMLIRAALQMEKGIGFDLSVTEDNEFLIK